MKKHSKDKDRRGRAIGRFGSLTPPSKPRNAPPAAIAALRATFTSVADRVERALEARTATAAIEAATIAAEALDASIVNAMELSTERPACAAGCSYCCRGVRVDVSVPEIARIVDHAQNTLAEDVLQEVRERARTNAEQTHGKHPLQYPQRLPCALLAPDGSCLVYAVRPVACRNEHSKSVEQCKAGHDEPQLGVTVPIDRIIARQFAGSVVIMGAARGVEQASGDAQPCELQEALNIAFTTPNAVARWLAGDDAFRSARIDPDEAGPARRSP